MRAAFLAICLVAVNGMRLPPPTRRTSAQPAMAVDPQLSEGPVPVVFGKILGPAGVKPAVRKAPTVNSHLDFVLKAPILGAAVGASSAFLTASIIDIVFKIAT